LALLVIGHKEVEDETVSVRLRSGTDLGPTSVSALLDRLRRGSHGPRGPY